MKVLVVGAGRVGTAVATRLTDAGHTVAALDVDDHAVARLRARLPHVHAEVGDGTDPHDLQRAGARGVDALAALTGNDERNLLAAGLARFDLGVPRTIVRIVDPAHAWLHTRELGVDVALDQADLLSSLVVEELALDEVAILTRLRRGQLELISRQVGAGSAAVGLPLREVGLPPGSLLVAVLRDDGPIVPRGDLVLRPDDEVIAITHRADATALTRAIGAEPDPAR